MGRRRLLSPHAGRQLRRKPDQADKATKHRGLGSGGSSFLPQDVLSFYFQWWKEAGFNPGIQKAKPAMFAYFSVKASLMLSI